jgi:hypothetical protein
VSSPPTLPAEIRKQVRQRANYLCEYCHTSERWQYVRFTMDHVVPVIAGGSETLENLALACFHCNRRKSNKQDSIDPETGAATSLFNPRLQLWAEHFVWSTDGLLAIPLTATGRATVALMELNRARILEIRRADVEVGRHPPATDPVQR